MNPTRASVGAFSCACLALLASCVELTGQRLVFFHDAARDELTLLLFHDGIHERKSPDNGDGAQQLAEYVKEGNVMLLDWPFHVQMKEVRQLAGLESAPPAQRALARTLAEQVTSRALGRYRDPEGRVGAAQLVRVTRASGLLAAANAAISETLLLTEESAGWSRTLAMVKAAAREKATWLRLEGHSLVVSFPVHSGEWARGKAQLLAEVEEELRENARKKATGQPALLRGALIQILGLSPFSIQEGSGRVTFRLGEPERPAVHRILLHDGYTPRLEATLEREVPASLDAALASALLAEKAGDPERDLAELLDWGPPEERVRALLNHLEDSKLEGQERSALRRRIADHLRLWAKAWNEAGNLPSANVGARDDEDFLDSCRAWYVRAVQSPAGG